MSLTHTCDGAGWVVGPETPMLSDASDWCWPGREPVPYGCHHLKCFICGAVVKQRAGWSVRTSALGQGTEWREKCVALYENDDWSALDPRGDDLFGKPPAAPYRCAGHPLPSLPFRYHGLTADADTDLTAVVRRVFADAASRHLDRWSELKALDPRWVAAHTDDLIRLQVGDEEGLILDLNPLQNPAGDYVRRMLAAGCAPDRVRAAIEKYMGGDWRTEALAALETP